MSGDILYATEDKHTAVFMRDLLLLFRRHGKAIVPTYQGEVSFHDSMRVIPFEQDVAEFVQRSGVDPEDFKK